MHATGKPLAFASARALPVLAALAALAALSGCDTNWTYWRMLDTRSRDEKRMVYPSTPPSDGIFVAIRGNGNIIDDPDEDLENPADSRPIKVIKAQPIVPHVEVEGTEPAIQLIQPSAGPGPSASQPGE